VERLDEKSVCDIIASNPEIRNAMKASQFRYHAPKTVDEAVAILADVAPHEGRVLAGGQSLVPIMAFRLSRPAHLVDINGIDGLNRISVDGDRLCIGACVRHVAFSRPIVEGVLGKLLSTVVQYIAHYPIRTRGTFCGSIAHADPSSEWCTVAMALGAEMVVGSVRGQRIIPAHDFFAGMMTNALREDELLIEVRLPLLTPDTRFGFDEFSRRTGDFAIAMALTLYRVEEGRIIEPRIAIGGAESHPRRILNAEQALEGQIPGPESFIAAANQASRAIEPMEDAQTSGEYRRDLVRTMTHRALERSIA
jgi:aerobic carbon-monoxide dehydrogenase medium subunit